MIQRKSRWSDPPVIIAALAVLNGGYWQYQAIGRADSAALVKQVQDNVIAITRLQTQVDGLMRPAPERLPNRR